jgi:phosphate-selective porin OprO/OprP
MKCSARDLLLRSFVLGCGAAVCAPPSATAAEGDTGLILSTKGGLKVESADGDFEGQVGGRLMLDYAYYDDDQTDLGSGSEIRRARLFASGKMWKVWKFKFQTDFAGNGVDIKDAYIQYGGFKPLSIKAGNFKEAFSIEELTSSKYITFMERALPVDAFAPSRNLGLQLHSHGNLWQGAIGLFGQGIDSPGEDESQSYGTDGRVTFAPINSDGRVLHVGGAFEWRTGYEGDEVRYRTRPESHVTNVRLVDTRDSEGNDIGNVDDTLKFNGELAGVFGPWSLQGEYIQTDVSRSEGSEDLDFNGYYIFGSWFLTGESRPYDAKNGRFGRVKPQHVLGKGGYGAWELGVRYSDIDLNSKEINGGKENNVTLGINWYPTSHTRLMFNYIYVDAETLDEDTGQTVDDNPNVFQVRAQVDF